MQLLIKLRDWLVADLAQTVKELVSTSSAILEVGANNTTALFSLRAKLKEMQREIDALKQRSENSDAALVEARGAMKFVTALRKELASLQALDMGFRETGKIIVIARVNNRDIVKIIDCPRNMAQNEYKAMVEMLERMYGAKLAYSDTPLGIDFTRTGE